MYTYLIGWAKLNKYYYGVRYAKCSNPKDLWVTYFTSSNYVNDFRKKYGEPDIIEVRKTFNSVNEAVKWEQKVLRRLKVNKDEKWLNKTYNGCFTYRGIKNTKPGWEASLKKTKGKTYKEIFNDPSKISLVIEQRVKTRKLNKLIDPTKDQRKKEISPETRERYRMAAYKRWSNKDQREKICASMRVPKTKRST